LIVLAVGLPVSAAAQSETWPIFQDYDEMRQVLDRLIRDRSINEMLVEFSSEDAMPVPDRIALEAQVRGHFPDPLSSVAIMQTSEMENGFSQQVLAYWDGANRYLYFHLLLQERDGQLLVIHFSLNSDVIGFLPYMM
jgi:hypothetical protein